MFRVNLTKTALLLSLYGSVGLAAMPSAIAACTNQQINGQLLGSDALGWVTPSVLSKEKSQKGERGKAAERFSLGAAPDGSPAVEHTITKGQPVHPWGYDTPQLFPSSGYKSVLLTYKMWQQSNKTQGRPGKFIALMGGRGKAGARYAMPSTSHGTEGWSNVSMHPTSNGISRIGGYSYTSKQSGHGTSYSQKGWSTPTGQWVEIAIHVRMNSAGMKDGSGNICVDGVLRGQINGLMWARNPSDAKGLWIRWRQMYGGDPKKLPPPMDLKEWYKDFAIYVSH